MRQKEMANDYSWIIQGWYDETAASGSEGSCRNPWLQMSLNQENGAKYGWLSIGQQVNSIWEK